MATFPENTRAHFTTLHSQQLDLTGFREVVLAEFGCPSAIQYTTSVHFKNRVAPEEQDDNNISGSTSTDTRKKAHIREKEKPYGMVTKCELPICPV